ncbi:MAG: DUF5663 domain-containing protein [Syntrophobacteraceae bacterium]|jgi:thymidylate synthase ThyX
MSEESQIKSQEEIKGIPLSSVRNPYIMNFCKVLVDKKGEKLEEPELKKLLEKMYKLYENLLGQNMVKALPEELRKEYLNLCNDLEQLSYEKIEEYFDKSVNNYEQIMKNTMREFAELYMSNRAFDPQKTRDDASNDAASSRQE